MLPGQHGSDDDGEENVHDGASRGWMMRNGKAQRDMLEILQLGVELGVVEGQVV